MGVCVKLIKEFRMKLVTIIKWEPKYETLL